MGDHAGWAVDSSARCSFQRHSSAIPRLIGKPPCESSMAHMSTQEAFSSTPNWKYDVFLSFCGEDTRKKFTDHLYTALKQKGIIVFRDDKNLVRGTYISHQLLEAIQESQYAVIVISENYSSSKWCLMELTKIMECKREIGLTILVIFYHVDPSNIRKHKGIFAEALARHRETTEVDKEQWKAALKEVCDLAGWHIHDSHESIVVEEICEMILTGMSGNSSNISKDLVGIESQVKEIMMLLCLGSDDVRFLGICGMGGIGKTTLARVVYERVSSLFDVRCFIPYVGEETRKHGLVHLQKQLICKILMERESNIWDHYEGIDVITRRGRNKKVLIVLDDVDEEEQLKALAGSRYWFGKGSRIIVTSRDRHLLTTMKYDSYSTYEVELLNYDKAMQLFSWKAFKKHYPEENYMELSKDIVNYARGLPLALEIFGSFLFGRTMDAWKSAQGLLKANPNAQILDKLQIGFDKLEYLQKQLFLDIACFFNEKPVKNVIHKLESFGFYPQINIEVLKDKYLLKISEDGQFCMHDLLQQMGQQIIHRQSLKEHGGPSRLWCFEDIDHVFKDDIGVDEVEGMVLTLPLQKKEKLNFESFSKLKKLRMLEITHKRKDHAWEDKIVEDLRTLEWHGGPSKFVLSNKLCVMTWCGYPLESLPTNFQPNNLVELIMPWSCIKVLWEGRKVFDKLKHIDLSYSQNLIETPNFSGVPNLRELDLQCCTSLSKVDPSIIFLRHLIQLSLLGCESLERLPEFKGLVSLEGLNLACCLRSKEFPNNVSGMECLEEFDAKGTALRRLPSSIASLKKLKALKVGSLSFPYEYDPNPISILLPNSFSGLSLLEILDLSNCNLSDEALPHDLGCLSSLWGLDLSGNKFVSIPDTIYHCSKLKRLELHNCSKLQALPKLPLGLKYLYLENCPSLKTFYNQMDMWTSRERSLIDNYCFVVAYFGCEVKPYKILYLHPRSPLWTWSSVNSIECVLASGPSLEYEIPWWFNLRSTNFHGIIQCRMDCISKNQDCWGYALFIVYQFHDQGNSSSRVFDGNNPAFPEFVCRLHANEDDPRDSLVFYVPEAPHVGPNGVWVFIKDLNYFNPGGKSHLKISIATKSLNVELKDCGARLVSGDNVLEFYEILLRISPCGLDLKSLKDYLPRMQSFYAKGPIKEDLDGDDA